MRGIFCSRETVGGEKRKYCCAPPSAQCERNLKHVFVRQNDTIFFLLLFEKRVERARSEFQYRLNIGVFPPSPPHRFFERARTERVSINAQFPNVYLVYFYTVINLRIENV